MCAMRGKERMTEGLTKEYTRTRAEVDLDAIRFNCLQARAHIREGVKLMAVIKADAYGHGAVPVMRTIDDLADGYGVASAKEALTLREAGCRKLILILGYVTPEWYPDMIEQEITLAVFTEEMARDLSAVSQRIGKPALVHLKLDTGMGRIGMAPVPESVELVKRIAAMPGIKITGMFTHFACADQKDKASALGMAQRGRHRDSGEARGELRGDYGPASDAHGYGALRHHPVRAVSVGGDGSGGVSVKARALVAVPGLLCEMRSGGDGHRLRTDVCDEGTAGDRDDPGGLRGRIFPGAKQPGESPDPRKELPDSGTCLHGPVYGGCDRGARRLGGRRCDAPGPGRRGVYLCGGDGSALRII